jgi:hypothetical protein
VVVAIEVVVVGTTVVVVVIGAYPKFTVALPDKLKVYGLLLVVKKYPDGFATDSVCDPLLTLLKV